MNDTNINHNNFNRQLLKLSIPIIIQNLLSAAVSSCDVVMLNYVGQSSISAGHWLPTIPMYSLWYITEWAPGLPFCVPSILAKRI